MTIRINGHDFSVQDVEIAWTGYVKRKFLRKSTPLTSSSYTQSFLREHLVHRDYEVFGFILLDNRNRAIDIKDLFRGTIDGASVHPREVVKEALTANAAALILYHNHPSGVAEPSQADEIITSRLREALALVDIRVLDHIIVGAESITSFVERGLL